MFNTVAPPRPSDKADAPHWLFRFAAFFCPTHVTIEQACTQQRLYDHHPDAAFHDAGQSRDDAMGIGSHQTALPFFLQSGFGKR